MKKHFVLVLLGVLILPGMVQAADFTCSDTIFRGTWLSGAGSVAKLSNGNIVVAANDGNATGPTGYVHYFVTNQQGGTVKGPTLYENYDVLRSPWVLSLDQDNKFAILANRHRPVSAGSGVYESIAKIYNQDGTISSSLLLKGNNIMIVAANKLSNGNIVVAFATSTSLYEGGETQVYDSSFSPIGNPVKYSENRNLSRTKIIPLNQGFVIVYSSAGVSSAGVFAISPTSGYFGYFAIYDQNANKLIGPIEFAPGVDIKSFTASPLTTETFLIAFSDSVTMEGKTVVYNKTGTKLYGPNSITTAYTDFQSDFSDGLDNGAVVLYHKYPTSSTIPPQWAGNFGTINNKGVFNSAIQSMTRNDGFGATASLGDGKFAVLFSVPSISSGFFSDIGLKICQRSPQDLAITDIFKSNEKGDDKETYLLIKNIGAAPVNYNNDGKYLCWSATRPASAQSAVLQESNCLTDLTKYPINPNQTIQVALTGSYAWGDKIYAGVDGVFWNTVTGGWVLEPAYNKIPEIDDFTNNRLGKTLSALSCVSLNNDMQVNASSDTNTNGEVTKLQQFLLGYTSANYKSANIIPTGPFGWFGSKTKADLVSFQQAEGLAASGKAECATRSQIANLTNCTMVPVCPVTRRNNFSGLANILKALERILLRSR